MEALNKVYANFSAWLYTREDRGASLVEYALLVALIAVTCIVAIRALGSNANDKITDAGNALK